MDFYEIRAKERKEGVPQLYPDWNISRSDDLMVRGKSFYAIWDEKAGLWSRDEYDVVRLVDEDLHRYANEHGGIYQVMNLRSFNTQIWTSFRKFMQHVSDAYQPLDEKLVFSNTDVKKTDYASRRLPYPLEAGTHDAWDELLGVLYSPEERDKIEWAIGSIVAGESKYIQKFFVFYGPAGSGKSTVLNIMQWLFDGYAVMFDAQALGNSNAQFATEAFRTNPLVAIQHDGDLSRINDNTKLNSIVSHEEMPMNEKYKPTYSARVNAMLFMGTNQPVKISDAKSGIIRRLIDVHPTGVMIDNDRYNVLMEMVKFELGAIAHHCLERFQEMGKGYYNSYRPLEMMLQTDVFYNYVENCLDIFQSQDGVTLKQAYELYKQFCDETGIEKKLPRHKFRDELRNYFDRFEEQARIDGSTVRSYYSGFKTLKAPSPFKPDTTYEIVLDQTESQFDHLYGGQPAQYAKTNGKSPQKTWEDNDQTLSDLDTSKLHYVQIPEHHIVIDFDLRNEDGEKDLEMNIKAASKWPPTYAEISQGGAGVHLHYTYPGDVTVLANNHDVGVEVKTLLGNASLRRKLTRCNNLEIATLTSGLKTKAKPMIEHKSVQSEKGLRELIARNLRKEIHPGTKPSIDFIKKILDDAYSEGMAYDLRDLRGPILTFAATSTNQAELAIKTVQQMQFVGKESMPEATVSEEIPIVFYDVEVYPNLFVVCWKRAGDANLVRMINPEPQDIEALINASRLVGFNNRRYDNHILYARFLGYSVEELYKLSQRIVVDNNSRVLFGEAYNLSYADIYDFSSKKQSLKKFEIELGIHHMELDLPWDEPVPENLWDKVVDYCCNDVVATEAVFNARKADFVARQILADLSGLSVNHTTQNHTGRLLFGDDKEPQKQFVYTDLSEQFPGYKFDGKESTYKGEVTGEGGYVYAEPGIYEDVALLDVASMHPTSILELNLFGDVYTPKFKELIDARLAIKRKDFNGARELLGGKLEPYLQDTEDSEALSYALKIVINIVYGLTSAKFPNLFRDDRNRDNIVAKRGALFMIDLKDAVQAKGFTVAHIKTDSIKIPEATPEIIEFVKEFGTKYGYDFEHEGTYERFCLVNDAVYIARSGDKWTAVGAQFQHPYVYKSLFTNEEIGFNDICETRSVVQGTMYLEFDLVPEADDTTFVHVGRTGSFVPTKVGGGTLWRVKDDKQYAVTGTKGYLWIEREMAEGRSEPWQEYVDLSYFEKLKDDAMAAIDYYGSFERFVKD